MQMIRSRALAVAIAILAAGCSDSPTGTDPAGKYQIEAALWLFGDPPASVVAQVERLDPEAPPATSATVRANGAELAVGPDGSDDNATFHLDLPGHVPGASYSVVAEIEGIQATCTLVSPTNPCALSMTSPAAGSDLLPGAPLDVQWEKTGTLPTEFEVNLHRCVEAPGPLAHSATVAPNATSYEIPEAATADVAPCDSVLLELIARDVVPLTGSLAGEGSVGYVVHSNESEMVERASTCPFAGITTTDSTGVVFSVDPDDWCVGLSPQENSFHPAYPNPTTGEVNVSFGIAIGGQVTLRILDTGCNVVRELLNGQSAAGRHVINWDGKDDAGQPLPPGIYRCFLVVGGFVCHGDIELQ